MTKSLIVTGGNKLQGEITPVPNKNAVLAALPACILTKEPVVYFNLPKSTDVEKMLEMLKLIGADIEDNLQEDQRKTTISCANLKSFEIDKKLGTLIRASIMFAGPLLARFGQARIPVPGGCVLGKRSIAAHVDAFTKLGISVEFTNEFATFTAPKVLAKTYKVWQSEASVSGTENAILYCAGIESPCQIYDAACEPHVVQLVDLMQSMGAVIEGKGSNSLLITGSKKLTGSNFIPEPDFIDIGSLICAAGLTQGKITIKNANMESLYGMYDWFEKFGLDISREGADLVVDGSQNLEIDSAKSGFPMASDDLPKFAPRPWPGFPVDLIPPAVALACKLQGKILFNNWMYETGLDFIRDLNAMGANIFMCDPQRIIVNGPCTFKGGKINSPQIIQAAMAIFLASLADHATTTILGHEVLQRRYPKLIDNFKKLGANIEELEV